MRLYVQCPFILLCLTLLFLFLFVQQFANGTVGSSSSLAFFSWLVTPRTVLGLPQLIHAGYALLELDVLALLVAMSLILLTREPSLALFLARGLMKEGEDAPRTSMGGSRFRTDICSGE